ncbi:MAG: hypothetical protein KAR24_00265 [Candidatus Pacebacteria bacterium]|nr:hypothetical protein [Candidatus Paceibacterota bacterium]
MEKLDKVVDDIGIEEAAAQIDAFFVHRDTQQKERALQQHEKTLAEQKELRSRWKNHRNT